MKKIISILVMCLFLLSIASLAFAEDSATIEDASEKQDDGSAVSITTAQAKVIGEKPNVVDAQNLEQKREQIKQRLEKAKIDFEQKKLVFAERKEEVKQKLEQAKKQFEEKREALMQAREKIKECSAEGDCEQVKKEYRAKAGPYLEKTADNILKLFEKLKTNLEQSSVENKDELIAELNAKISNVEELKQKAEELGENAEKEQIQEIAKQMREEWNSAKKLAKVSAGQVVLDRYAGVLVKIDHLNDVMDKVLAKMKEKGMDTTSVEPKITEFKGHLDDATTSFEEAKKLYSLSSTEVDFAKAHVKLAEAKQHLVEAHAVLKEIVSLVKEQKAENVLNEELTSGEDSSE